MFGDDQAAATAYGKAKIAEAKAELAWVRAKLAALKEAENKEEKKAEEEGEK